MNEAAGGGGHQPYDPEQSVDFMTQQQMYDQMLHQQQQQAGARPNSIDLKRQYPPGYQGKNIIQLSLHILNYVVTLWGTAGQNF